MVHGSEIMVLGGKIMVRGSKVMVCGSWWELQKRANPFQELSIFWNCIFLLSQNTQGWLPVLGWCLHQLSSGEALWWAVSHGRGDSRVEGLYNQTDSYMTWEWSGLCFQNTLWKIEGSHDNYLIPSQGTLDLQNSTRPYLLEVLYHLSLWQALIFWPLWVGHKQTHSSLSSIFSNTQSRGYWRKPRDQDSKCNWLPFIRVWITNIWIVLCWSCLESPTFGLSCVWSWPASLIVAFRGWVSFFIFCSEPSIRHWSCLLPLSI